MDVQTSCEGLRILLVGPYPPPYGGIASHLTTLIPGLLARGAADVSVVSFGARDEVVQAHGATVYYYHPRRYTREFFSPRNWRTIGTTIAALACARLGLRQVLLEAMKAVLLSQVAERHGSHVVSFYQSDASFAMYPCAHLWRNRRGVVLTVFGEAYEDASYFENRRKFMTRFLARPHAVAASSHHCACGFATLLGISRSIQSVYYGIDLNRFSMTAVRAAYRAELGLADDDVLLVFMGRFTENMGIGRVIEIVPTLLQQLPLVTFLLVGAKGPYTDAAALLAAQYPGRVCIMHDVPFDLQPSIYAASDIVLAPSHDQHACMGMSIKEAMAASRPVIGSLAGGIPEAIIDGVTGFLVPLDETKHVDAAVFCEAIARLAADPALRASMGAAARCRAEDIFSMDRTIDRMGSLFMDAIPA